MRALLLPVLVAGVVVAAPSSAIGDDHVVTFPSGAAAGPYAPATVQARPGDTVTFNGNFTAHPLVFDAGEFPTQASGTSERLTFAQPGRFAFHCQVHASMTGVVQVAANQFATPEFAWTPAAPVVGQAVTFSAGAFADPDGAIVAYQWDLDGDGAFESAGAQVAHTYAAPGTVHVALRYVDDVQGTSPATVRDVGVSAASEGSGGSGTASRPPAGSGSTTPPPGDQGAGPAPAGTAAPGVRVATARALAFRGGIARVTIEASAAGAVRVTLRRGATTLATGRATVRAGTARVRVRLTRSGARRLRRAHTLRATLTVTLRTRAGRTSTAHRTLTLRTH
jgi:plastocyanin